MVTIPEGTLPGPDQPWSRDPGPTSPPGAGGGVPSMAEAIRTALGHFAALTGRQPESVSGMRGTESGWSVLVDVLELPRIPDSTSVLALYRVDLDRQGDVLAWERLRRFTRGETDLG